MQDLPRLARGLVAVSLLAVALPSFAELGAKASSIQADAARLQASPRVTSTSRYAVHEMTAAGGTTVREYVAPSGTVFAVTWHGTYKPDLRQLMGEANFAAYQQQVAARTRRIRGPQHIEINGLVVDLGGHPRDFHGRAFLRSQLPAGTDPKEIQ